jgi:thiol-disulfide isomerase/thioredoxin
VIKYARHFYRIFFVLIFLINHSLKAQDVQVINAPQMYDLMDHCDTDLCVYNFWATWCAPCVREIPHFEKISKSNSNIKVSLISLDNVDDLYTRVKTFINKREIHSEVLLLDETDFNEIIPNISDEWSGAIPATLIVDRNGKKYFYEKEFKEGELKKP